MSSIVQFKEALIRLTLERGYATLTVADITERAMVNRSTFYRHYQDKDDLVGQCLQELLERIPVGDLLEIARAYPSRTPRPPAEFFGHIEENADFYRAMLGPDGMASFATLLVKRIKDAVSQETETLRRQSAVRAPAEVIPSFIASAVVGVLTWWLEQDQPPDAQQITQWFVTLVAPGIRKTLGFTGGS
jgi:AcrR family transcriptional regulator